MNPVPSVVELIAQRIREKSTPGERRDPYKVALVVEGGMMRTVVSAGMACALQALGALPVFDSLYGSSAGAGVCFYFVAEKLPLGVSVFYDDINNKSFINPFRLVKRKPPIDYPYLMKELIQTDKHFGWDKILNSQVPINVAVTELKECKTVYLSDFKTEKDIEDAFCWSCFIPIFGGQPVQVGDSYYADGGALAPIPLDKAVTDENTHVMVLLSRPEGYHPKKERIAVWFFEHYIKKQFPRFALDYKKMHIKQYQDTIKKIDESLQNPEAIPHIQPVRLSLDKKEISRIEKKRDVLRQGAIDGYEAVLNLFKDQGLEIDSKVHVI